MSQPAENETNCFENQITVSGIFQAKNTNIFWLLPLKCDNLLLFTVSYNCVTSWLIECDSK